MKKGYYLKKGDKIKYILDKTQTVIDAVVTSNIIRYTPDKTIFIFNIEIEKLNLGYIYFKQDIRKWVGTNIIATNVNDVKMLYVNGKKLYERVLD